MNKIKFISQPVGGVVFTIETIQMLREHKKHSQHPKIWILNLTGKNVFIWPYFGYFVNGILSTQGRFIGSQFGVDAQTDLREAENITQMCHRLLGAIFAAVDFYAP